MSCVCVWCVSMVLFNRTLKRNSRELKRGLKREHTKSMRIEGAFIWRRSRNNALYFDLDLTLKTDKARVLFSCIFNNLIV